MIIQSYEVMKYNKTEHSKSKKKYVISRNATETLLY